jgi:hypothetical protein
MTEVHRRAQRHADRAGEPLDGLVNMFDLGIVLAVAFLIAGIGLSKGGADQSAGAPSIIVGKSQRVVTLKPGQRRVPVTGAASIGRVYELPGGQLVYVAKK